MDGLAEDSPLIPAVLFADVVDRLLTARPLFQAGLGVFVGYFAIFGGLLDLLLVLGILAWFNVNSLAVVWHNWQLTNYVSTAVASLITLKALSRVGSLIRANVYFSQAGPARPLLIPARTTHRRIFPEKHSFSYSYLLTGVPVGTSGTISGLISVDVTSSLPTWMSVLWSSKAWFDVSSDDYLQRGHDHGGLRGKLDKFLISQGADLAAYPHAYLVTAARFLGYHFNPVSFWYLYSDEKVLSAIVLEVNNTFGERRPYLVPRDFEQEAKLVSETSATSAQNGEAAVARIKNSWNKDFHVSPFNSRKGTYSLMASDPLCPDMKSFRGIDVTINLLSSKQHPKLVARLFSEGEAIDPMRLGLFQRGKFILDWFWVGFVTFPRIVKEAALLFFKRKLHVWYRPEPLKESTARFATTAEKDLEVAFRLYLRHLVEHSAGNIAVRYIPSGIPETADVFVSKEAKEDPESSSAMELKVLTPIFYTRFVHYAHDFEAVFAEFRQNGTIWVDKPDLLPKIFFRKPSPPLHASTVLDFIYVKCMQHLRQRPELIKYPAKSIDKDSPGPTPAVNVVDIRDFRISPMDAFILEETDSRVRRMYRSTVLKIFIADWLFMSSVELFGLMELAWRFGVAYGSASLVNDLISAGLGG